MFFFKTSSEETSALLVAENDRYIDLHGKNVGNLVLLGILGKNKRYHHELVGQCRLSYSPTAYEVVFDERQTITTL